MNQQCWLWGLDVRREAGNLLLARGFERVRAADGSSASSQYTLRVGHERRIRLWGFGIFYGNGDEGIYLNRFEFLPRLATLNGNRWHGASEFQGLTAARDTVLLREVVHWIAGYEQWVLGEYGAGYRRACLAGWKKRHVAAEELPTAWEELAEALERPVRTRFAKVGPFAT